MNLTEYCESFRRLSFPKSGEQARPPRDDVRYMQASLEQALRSDTFIVDCLEYELDHLDRREIRRGLAPFLTLSDFGIRFALGYWAPDKDAGPHEHTDWTITAVCHNALQVFTYDRDLAYDEGRLVQKNRFPAPQGRVGHIYDPCIHNPHNPTEVWTLSLHIAGAYDGRSVSGDGRVPFGLAARRSRFSQLGTNHPFVWCAAARQREVAFRVLITVLSISKDPRAFSLLQRIYASANIHTKRMALQAMRQRDSERASSSIRQYGDAAIKASSRIRAVSPALEREVRTRNGHAELVARCPWGDEILLRVDAWAREALDALAREQELVVGDLPGGLDEDERSSIVEAAEMCGLFTSGTPTTQSPLQGLNAP